MIIVLLAWFSRFLLPSLWPDGAMFGIVGGIGGGALGILIWWLFFSRAPWVDRIGAIVLMFAVAAVTTRIIDRSVATGMMGMMFEIAVIPGLCLALVVGAAISRGFDAGARRMTLAAAIVIACVFWGAVRTDGITGDGQMQLAWRWAKTPEQKLLASPNIDARLEIPSIPPKEIPEGAAGPVAGKTSKSTGAVTPTMPIALKSPATVKAAVAVHHPVEWPGFRGPHRDDVVSGIRINTDWAASPPVQMWRRAVGPGWSSFAVGDGLIYTQEQRGDAEVVTCYSLKTGEPVWTHRDTTRFWESNAGAGPRGTPTLDEGRVYTFGATGILNALDAATGKAVWTRKPGVELAVKTPDWGFSSSPLVVDGTVIVSVYGRLAAYDGATGEPRWRVMEAHGSYGSPQLMTIGGVPQVVLLNGGGAISVAPADGKVLWRNAWTGAPMLQPAQVSDTTILVTTGDTGGGAGTRRLAIAQREGSWSVEEKWTSPGLKPYFNDIVVHKDHAYGLDNSILSCIDLEDGKRMWKGGRYGHGQVLLLSDQDVLLVLTEEGEVALVAAMPNQFTELAKFKAIEGKTWNHPVLAGDVLLVRNGEEMAAFRLSRTGG